MLFTRYDHISQTCSFCGKVKADDENTINLYGFKKGEPSHAICDSCLVETVYHAQTKQITVIDMPRGTHCDFCDEPLSSLDSVYSRREALICIECIRYMIGVLLEVNMKPGIKVF